MLDDAGWKGDLLCFSQGESGQPQSSFSLSVPCQFCWQLDPSQYRCSNSTSCMTVSCPRRRYNATCDVLEHVHCLGMRQSEETAVSCQAVSREKDVCVQTLR